MTRAAPLVAAIAALLPLASASCTREGLLAAAQTYITAITTGSLSPLHLATTNFTYHENNKPADLAKSALFTSGPLKLDLTRSTADTVACASYTLFISTAGAKPYVVSTQIRHPEGTDDVTGTISLIDTIVATKGDLFFDATKTLTLLKAEDWGVIPEGNRTSRAELKRIGDAYLDMWTDAKAYATIEWWGDCERVEGSQFTKPCGVGLPKGGSAKVNGMRRYVIDETVGSVDILCSFDSISSIGPDSHETRVEGGKIKYVHTVTAMNRK
ncbi:hypothetical protein QBC39DRAFT_414907 [Podospora conica]|nr:hypothetical protein QBC39DRAFT_414907 [Schizothecium conicum]